jgi:hypothetical protein
VRKSIFATSSACVVSVGRYALVNGRSDESWVSTIVVDVDATFDVDLEPPFAGKLPQDPDGTVPLWAGAWPDGIKYSTFSNYHNMSFKSSS